MLPKFFIIVMMKAPIVSRQEGQKFSWSRDMHALIEVLFIPLCRRAHGDQIKETNMMQYDGSHALYTAWKKDLRYRAKLMMMRAGGTLSMSPELNLKFPQLTETAAGAPANKITEVSGQSSEWQQIGSRSPATPSERIVTAQRPMDPNGAPFVPAQAPTLPEGDAPQTVPAVPPGRLDTRPRDGSNEPLPASPAACVPRRTSNVTQTPPRRAGASENAFIGRDSPQIAMGAISPAFPIPDRLERPISEAINPIDYAKIA